jgi:hypothetical protein
MTDEVQMSEFKETGDTWTPVEIDGDRVEMRKRNWRQLETGRDK